MLNKLMHSVLAGFWMFFLVACGESQQDQSFADHLSRADVYQEQGQYKAATIEYKNAIKKSKADVSVLVAYANMLNHLGQYPSALGLLESATEESRNREYFVELVETYQGLTKYRSAKSVIDDHLSSDNSIEVTILKAENELGLGNLKQSDALFQKALQDEPENSQALLGKAKILVREGEFEKGLVYLNKIPAGSPSYVKSKLILAGVRIGEDRLDLSESILTELLSTFRNTDIMEPEKAVVLERLSYVLTRQGRSNEAYIYTKLLSEAFPGSNEVKNQFQAAVKKMDEGDLPAAKEMLLKILSDFPNYSRATQLLGVISYLEGDMEGASKYLSDSVDPEVANEMTRHIYAATNLKLNDPKKVLEILEPGINDTQVVSTLALYGVAAISDKQYKKGESALLKALSLDDKNVRVRLALANFYRNSPNPDLTKEKAQLDTAYSLAPTDKQVLTETVSFIVRNEGLSQAEQFLNSALKNHPNDSATNFLAGSLVAGTQNYEKALAYFNKALKSAPDGEESLNILFAKGRAELALEKAQEAQNTFSGIIKSYPKNSMGYKGLMSVFLLKNDFEGGVQALEGYANKHKVLAPYGVLIEISVARQDLVSAKEYFDQAKKLEVDKKELAQFDHAIRYVEAVMALKVNDFSEARSIVAGMLSEDPENLRLLSFLVDIEMKSGQLNEASKILEQIDAINPEHPVLNIFKADIAIAKNDMNAAKGYLNNAWRASPTDLSAEKLYKVLGALGDKELQSKHLKNWLEMMPASPVAKLYEAIYFQQTMQKTKAIESYETVLRALPNNVMALNNLGWIYFEKNDDRSLELLKKAAELAPESAAVLDSYGWVLAKNGRKQEGLKYLEKAFQLAPNEAEIKAHLDEIKSSN